MDVIYTKNFDCSTNDPIQKKLNKMYCYKESQTMYTHRLRINLFCDLLKLLINRHVIKSFDSAIDIGCNVGFYSKLISDFGFKNVLGVDLEDHLISRANQYFSRKNGNGIIHFRVMNAEAIE